MSHLVPKDYRLAVTEIQRLRALLLASGKAKTMSGAFLHGFALGIAVAIMAALVFLFLLTVHLK